MIAPIDNRQSTIANPDDWLTIDRVAELTDQSERHWQRLAGKLFSRSLARQAPPPSGHGKPTWWIHRSAHPKLSRYPAARTRDQCAHESLLTRFARQHVERAYRRAYWLDKWRRACRLPRIAGQTRQTVAADVVEQAQAAEGDEFGISVRTLQAWGKAYDSLDREGRVRGVEALVDRYGSSRTSVVTRSPEAIDYFFKLYHSQAKHSVKTCHKTTANRAENEGWSWPVTVSATTRWLRQTENLADSCLHRDGRTEFSHRYMQHLKIDWSVLEPGERYILDHAQMDLWCRYKDGQIRPWVTAIIDARSRMLVGHVITPSPHQDSIIAAMRMAFRDRAIPAKVHMDHGKDFCSKLITGHTKAEQRRLRKEHGPGWREVVRHQLNVFWHGILGELQIDVVQATPYHPWAKALIERWFSTMHDQFDKTFVTYSGRSPETRPECLEVIRKGADVPTLDDVRARFVDFVELYQRTPHRGDGMNGLAPLDVWQSASHLRRALESELLALMQARGVYRVGANGVTFRLSGTEMTYGAASRRLRAYAGRDVFITLDPEKCELCYAYTAERHGRRFIDRLDCNMPLPANTPMDDLREAISTQRRRNKDFDRAARQAPAHTRDVAHQIVAAKQAELKRLRATGTDDVRPADANITVVRTGFEGVSVPTYSQPSGSVEDPGSMEARDALQRMAAFASRKEPEPVSDDTWSRLRDFNRKGDADD